MRGAGKWVLRGVEAVVLAVLFWGATLGFQGAWPYGVANWTSAWLGKAKPAKEKVDRRLWFCSALEIEMKDSWWGRNYVLQEGEWCVQYRVFGSEEWPIDVVYGPEGRVRVVFDSYE
ncbi:MAG: hypothetical protein IJT88_05685 [Kiritimatiellae bacterium]|nr:hypothetical protein [Kiritimatiellia bacterium]